jgi:hypothetical protein
MLVLSQVGFADDHIRLHNIPPIGVGRACGDYGLQMSSLKKYRAELPTTTVPLCSKHF